MWCCPICGREFKNPNQSHYCKIKPTTIDEYIALQNKEVQPILQKIRQTIKKAAPGAQERISYHMPAFWLGKILIYFAAHKAHIGIYPGDLDLIPFKEKLAAYKTTKGAIQFPLDKPIDYELIAEITRYKLEQLMKK